MSKKEVSKGSSNKLMVILVILVIILCVVFTWKALAEKEAAKDAAEQNNQAGEQSAMASGKVSIAIQKPITEQT